MLKELKAIRTYNDLLRAFHAVEDDLNNTKLKVSNLSLTSTSAGRSIEIGLNDKANVRNTRSRSTCR